MGGGLSRVYPVAGLLAGYVLVMAANPIRRALRDGFRCITRYERVWLTFAVLGFAYFIFQFAAFRPGSASPEGDLSQVLSATSWRSLADPCREAILPAMEGVAGIFDNATTTYPLSVAGAILLLVNWRGLHSAWWRALRKLYRGGGILIYLLVFVSLLATLMKPLVYWRLPTWSNQLGTAHLLQIAAVIDAVSFVFEYFVGIYIQVYLITVCLGWIKGLSFREGALFAFAVRRFSYVLEWSGVVVGVSLVVVRVPLLLAYFMNVPNVLDYLPAQRLFMSGFILVFCSVQASLVLHNETLSDALRAHWQLLRRDWPRVACFFILAGINFFLVLAIDALIRRAIGDRALPILVWGTIVVFVRALVTGWFLATWIVLFRQCETRRVAQESWVQY